MVSNSGEQFYGEKIIVRVTGTILYQIPSGNPVRSDEYIQHAVRSAINVEGVFDSLKIELESRVKGPLEPDPKTRDAILQARIATRNESIGAKET